MPSKLYNIDELDRRLIRALAADPRATVMELTRKLGVARATTQSRLDKLVARGIISFGPVIYPRALGYEVLAFTTIEIAQGRLDDVVAHIRDIPEVLEAHTTTGSADLHCRVVARTHEHLQSVMARILKVKGIDRTTTIIALTDQIPMRFFPLLNPSEQTR